MKIGRVNETVKTTAKALQDSVHAVADSHNHQQPFVVPVSHLLRVEKCRGFEYGPVARDQSDICLLRSPSHSRKRWTEIHQRGASRTCSPRVVINPLTVPSHRSFSSEIKKERPQPTRRPPIAPRKPLIPRSTVSGLSPQEDDVLSNIPATTGAEHIQRSRNEREQFRKRQIKEDAIDTPWFKNAATLDNQLKHFQETVDYIAVKTRVVKTEVREAVDRLYMRFSRKVFDLQECVHWRAQSIDAFLDNVRLAREEAARRGKMDYVVHQHLEAIGFGALARGINALTDQETALRREIADLKYTIDWTVWHTRRTMLQTKEACRASYELKRESGRHRESVLLIDIITEKSKEIIGILYDLYDNLTKSSQPVSQEDAEHYRQMLATTLDVDDFASVMHPLGHTWRALDRHALVASRLPVLNDHVSLDFRARAIIEQAKGDNRKVQAALWKAKSIRSRDWSDRFFYLKMANIHSMYTDTLNTFSEQYLDLLQEGLVMLNPLMQSELGRLKYAAIRPFNLYNTAVLETQRALRAGMEYLEDQKALAKMQLSHKRRERFMAQLEFFKEAHRLSKVHVREFMISCNDATYWIITRLSEEKSDPYLARVLSRNAQSAKAQSAQGKALDNLSSLSAYQRLVYPDGWASPFSIRGQQGLYPRDRPHPVELVSSHRRVGKALQEMLSEKVIGIDMLGNEDQFPTFVSIATLEKAIVIDWPSWSTSDKGPKGLNQTLLTRLMEDPNILKVIHSIDAVQRHLSPKNIFPRSVVSLIRAQAVKGTVPLGRAASGGSWNPPRRAGSKEKPLMSFLGDLAFLSVYNLWTFLYNVTTENTSSIDPHIRTNISRTREQFLFNIATTNHETALELGPLDVDDHGAFMSLATSLNQSISPGHVVQIAKLAAERKLFKLGERAKPPLLGNLMAYYLFTSCAQSLASIGEVLKKQDPASDILSIVQRFDLTLHAKDRARLMPAEKGTQKESESVTIATGLERSAPSILEKPVEPDTPGQQTAALKSRKRSTMEKRRAKAQESHKSASKQSSELRTELPSVMNNVTDVSESAKDNGKLPTQPKAKQAGGKHAQGFKSSSKSSVIIRSPPSLQKIREKGILNATVDQPNIGPETVRNVLSPLKHKTIGKVSKLPLSTRSRSRAQRPGVEKGDSRPRSQRVSKRTPTPQQTFPTSDVEHKNRLRGSRSVVLDRSVIFATASETKDNDGPSKVDTRNVPSFREAMVVTSEHSKATSTPSAIKDTDKGKTESSRPSSLFNRVQEAEKKGKEESIWRYARSEERPKP